MRRLITIIIASLGGVILGVLFAPNTGRATRARVKDRMIHYAHEVGHIFTRWLPSKARFFSGKIIGLANIALGFLAIKPTGIPIDDTTITDKARSRMGRSRPKIDIHRMNINTEDGVIYLRGVAMNFQQKSNAEKIVKDIEGVSRVVNELRIAAA